MPFKIQRGPLPFVPNAIICSITMFLAGKCLLAAETGGFVAKLRFKNPFSNNKHDGWLRCIFRNA